MANRIYDPQFLNEKLKSNTEALKYLHDERSLSEEVINKALLGYINAYGKGWISIPLYNHDGNFIDGYKLRAFPLRENDSRYICYPNGLHIDCPYNTCSLDQRNSHVVICEGEFDCLLLMQEGYNAITSSTGVNSFKDDYFDILRPFQEITILFDNDFPGSEATQKLAERLLLYYPGKTISIASIPIEEDIKDVSDYVRKYKTIKDVLNSRVVFSGIETAKFDEIGIKDIQKCLEGTIKGDNLTKVLTFLGMVSTYTPESQLNLALIGPSSTGKTYIANTVTKFLPEEDLTPLQYASPKAFYHEKGEYDKATNTLIVNLEKKCLFFADQPTTQILEILRPILSHDRKESVCKITDKNAQGGHTTKSVIIRGFPSLIFCSADLKMDEQESTRFIILSPEISDEKILEGMRHVINTTQNEKPDPLVDSMKDRILAIKYQGIKDILLSENQKQKVQDFITSESGDYAPRDMRDIKKIISIVQSIALLNFSKRKRIDDILYVDDFDLEETFTIWEDLRVNLSYGIPPYVINVFKEVILPALDEKRVAKETIIDTYIQKVDITTKYEKVYRKLLRMKEFNDIMAILVDLTFLESGNDDMDGRKTTYRLSTAGKKYIMRMWGCIENYGKQSE